MSRTPVCLFAHFDPGGRIFPHVLHYVTALRGLGYRVVFASSGRPPPEEDIAAARRAGAAELVCRKNGGIDFGAWRDLLRAGHADGATGVLFANDSVYGPLWDLATATQRFHASAVGQPDAWGMVESLQGSWHLQSWFLHLSAAVLSCPAIQRLFDQPFERMTKEEIVVRGELGLGAALRAEGARCGALYGRRERSRLARLVPGNPMHLDWRGVITRRLVPFVKAELLRCNPMAIPWIADWPDVLARQAGFPAEWVHSHLYAYTGVLRPAPTAPFRTPIRPLGLRGRALYAALTIDHAAALRSLVSPPAG